MVLSAGKSSPRVRPKQWRKTRTTIQTTIDLSDALFNFAKELAQQRRTTLRALVEESLRRVPADAQATGTPAFQLTDARVRGGELLEPDRRRWQELEDAHVVSRLQERGARSRSTPRCWFMRSGLSADRDFSRFKALWVVNPLV